MEASTVFKGLAGVVLVSAAWHFLGRDMVAGWGQPPVPAPRPFQFQNDAPSADLPAAGQAPGAAGAAQRSAQGSAAAIGARKCRQGNKVIYTDRDCPKGTQELGIKSGVVTVVKADPLVVQAAKGAASRAPHARDLLGPPGEAERIREKMMERAINP